MDIEVSPGIYQSNDVPLDGTIYPNCPLSDVHDQVEPDLNKWFADELERRMSYENPIDALEGLVNVANFKRALIQQLLKPEEQK